MDLNTALIILGLLALVALVAHGLWSSRREKTHFFKNANTFTRDGRLEQAGAESNLASDPLSNLPIQQASQLHRQQQPLTAQTFPPQEAPQQQGLDFDEPVMTPVPAANAPLEQAQASAEERAVEDIKIILPGQAQWEKNEPVFYDMSPSAARNPTPLNEKPLNEPAISEQATQQAKYSAPNYEYPPRTPSQTATQTFATQPLAPQATATATTSAKSDLIHRSIADIEANFDQDEGLNFSSELRQQLADASHHSNATQSTLGGMSQPSLSQANSLQSNPLQPSPSQPEPLQPSPEAVYDRSEEQPQSQAQGIAQQDFIVLYVVAPENRVFNGAYLAQALEELGFVYSEEGIFHRHLDTLASPVLYSVANIHQPGTFDLATMAEFSTIGVAIFMQLSGSAKDRVNFIHLCQDARNLADKLAGYVLDENQELFTEQTKSAYLASLSQ